MRAILFAALALALIGASSAPVAQNKNIPRSSSSVAQHSEVRTEYQTKLEHAKEAAKTSFKAIDGNLTGVFARFKAALQGFYVAKAALEVVPEYALTPTSKHTVAEFVLHHRSLVAHGENLKRNFDEASKHAKVLANRNLIAIENGFIEKLLLHIVAKNGPIESFNRSVLEKFWTARSY
jgi:hypothetical protein